MRLRIERFDIVFLLVAAGMVFLYVNAAGGGFPLDDSWIHQTYGRNLGVHGQWAFLIDQPSAASTSPLYTLLLALGYALRIPFSLWTHGLGVLALALTGMLGARLARQLEPQQKFLPWALGLALILAWHLIWAAASGMETMLFSMFTLALIWLAWLEMANEKRTVAVWVQRGVMFGIVSALATLTRPEGVVLVGVIGLLMLLVRPQGSWRGVLIWGFASGAAFVLVLSPYLVYNYTITGGLLPDTAAAKQAQNAPLLELAYPFRVLNMLYPLVAGGQLILLPAMIYYVVVLVQKARTTTNEWLYLLPIIWAVLLVGLYAARLPAPYQHGRYVIPALPGLIVSGVLGTVWLLRDWRRSLIGRALARTVMIGAAFLFVYFAFMIGVSAYRTDVRIIDEEMVATAHWIDRNLPRDELLVIHDIGAVGYFAPRPILDLAGLVSPEVIPIILDAEALWALMQERDGRYLMAFPDQIPNEDINDPRLCLLYNTNGETSRSVNGPSMAVYQLNWTGSCP